MSEEIRRVDVEVLQECVDDLEAELCDRYRIEADSTDGIHQALLRRFDLDMEVVHRARKVLVALYRSANQPGQRVEGWAMMCSDGEPDFRVGVPESIHQEFPGAYKRATLIIHAVDQGAV